MTSDLGCNIFAPISEWQNITNGDLRRHTTDSPPSTNGDIEGKHSPKQEKGLKRSLNNVTKVSY